MDKKSFLYFIWLSLFTIVLFSAYPGWPASDFPDTQMEQAEVCVDTSIQEPQNEDSCLQQTPTRYRKSLIRTEIEKSCTSIFYFCSEKISSVIPFVRGTFLSRSVLCIYRI